ncbi:unnamed protein product [Closterium sp. NIES-65]|nr:unnamed protein product [Closterium sp. NIES-65]
MREMATMKNDVMFLDASFTVIANFVGLRREEVVSAATQLLMQGNPGRSGAKAEACGTKNAPHTPQRPSGRKRRVDSSPEEDVVHNATRVALASSFAACDPTARLLQNPLLSGGTIPHWMFTRGRPLLGVTVPAGADAWGDTSGHETVKAEEEEDLVSDTEDEEDGDDTCATKYTGVKLEKASSKFGVKILIKEGGKRRQQRLGAYTSEEEAAYAYAAGAFVLRPQDKIPNTVSLSAAEKAMLRGCTKEDLQLLVEARKWWRWRSWREAREGVNWKVKRGRKRVVATRTSRVDTDGHDVRISSRVLEQLIWAQDRSAKENARLEALFLNAMAQRSGGSRKRKARNQRDPEQGCMNSKRKRGETWSGGSDDDGEDDEEDTHGSVGRHMRTAKSPILQRALAHLPTDKAWKRVCELARVHLFLNRPTSSMTFYPSSDDKTHGVCAVLFRDDRDASSLWAPEKERSIEKIRERIGIGADPPETLVLTSWAHDRDGMPFASRASATCAKAAFKPKKAGLVMILKVSDCVLYWEARKGRLSNSAGGNAHVVDGLKVLVKEAVERAIRIYNPEYDAEREAWIWGHHGLRISACGLEHMKSAAATELLGIVGDDDLSASLGD